MISAVPYEVRADISLPFSTNISAIRPYNATLFLQDKLYTTDLIKNRNAFFLTEAIGNNANVS